MSAWAIQKVSVCNHRKADPSADADGEHVAAGPFSAQRDEPTAFILPTVVPCPEGNGEHDVGSRGEDDQHDNRPHHQAREGKVAARRGRDHGEHERELGPEDQEQDPGHGQGALLLERHHQDSACQICWTSLS